MSDARARNIKLLLFDVDGVCTDGTIWLFPAAAGVQPRAQGDAEVRDLGGYGVQSANMVEAKGFHAHDGTAISLARLAGVRTGLITKRISDTVALRARDLRLDFVLQGIADKRSAFEQILEQAGLTAEEVAFVGDDVIDLPVMRMCGLAIAVPNGRPEVIKAAHYVTEHVGGQGAVRDAVEYILRAQGKLDAAVAEYLNERS